MPVRPRDFQVSSGSPLCVVSTHRTKAASDESVQIRHGPFVAAVIARLTRYQRPWQSFRIRTSLVLKRNLLSWRKALSRRPRCRALGRRGMAFRKAMLIPSPLMCAVSTVDAEETLSASQLAPSMFISRYQARITSSGSDAMPRTWNMYSCSSRWSQRAPMSVSSHRQWRPHRLHAVASLLVPAAD